MHARATVLTWLSNDRRRSSTTPRTFISSETVRSTPATDADDTVDMAACSWVAVPIARASDLSGLSCRPFCKYHCLTSAVHMDPWAHLSPQPKRHLDRFSHFCRAQSDRPTDMPTDRATRSVTIGSIISENFSVCMDGN